MISTESGLWKNGQKTGLSVGTAQLIKSTPSKNPRKAKFTFLTLDGRCTTKTISSTKKKYNFFSRSNFTQR
jgi:hypothetical protein